MGSKLARVKMPSTEGQVTPARDRRIAEIFRSRPVPGIGIRYPGLIAALILGSLWFLLTETGMLRAELIPAPRQVFTEGLADWSELSEATAASLGTAFLGYLLGFLGAVPVGLLMGRYSKVEAWTNGAFDFFRAIPAVAVAPLALLILADPFQVRVVSVAWGCFFLAAVNVIGGVRHVPATLEDAASSFGASERVILQKVGVPSLLPYLLSTLRQNVSVALIVIVVADMVIGLAPGLGFYILRSQGNALYGRMYMAIVVIALVGYAAFRALEIAQVRLFPWWARPSVER